MFRPSTFGSVVTYSLFSLAGLFLGSEAGLLTGGLSAKSTLTKDEQTRRRIESAYTKFKIDLLRKSAEDLEKSGGGSTLGEKML